MLQATIVYGMQLTVHELKRHFCHALWRHSFYARLVEFLSGVQFVGGRCFDTLELESSDICLVGGLLLTWDL